MEFSSDEIVKKFEKFKMVMNGDEIRDFSLWKTFQEVFEKYTIDRFNSVPRVEHANMRSYIRKRGVWVQRNTNFYRRMPDGRH